MAAMRTWTLRNLKSARDHLRRDALEEIIYSRDPQFIPSLMELLVSDPLYPTPHETSVALQSFGDMAVPSLLETLNSSDCNVRFHAALVLRELADDRAVRPLIAALESDPDEGVRKIAAQALGGIRDLRAFEPLVRALDRDPSIAAFAVRALAQFGNQQAIRVRLEEISDIRDIDRKLMLIAWQAPEEHRAEARRSGDHSPSVDCSVCGGSLPRLSALGGPSSWRYGGAFCTKCHSNWCIVCQPSEVERGQHRRCGGQSSAFPIKR